MLNPLREAVRLIRRHRIEFLVLNAAFFSLFVTTMTVTVIVPSPLLFVGAVCEAFEIIFLVRYFI